MKTIILFLCLQLLNFAISQACFILCLKNDSTMLVANHEDWFKSNAAIKIVPPALGKYGSVIFTFTDEGWAQGGMNEKGLFFDAAYTPFQELDFSPEKKEYGGYIWQTVLDKCANVQEALELLEQFQLPELEEAHIVLADANGSAVVLGIDHGKFAVLQREKNYLMQTNFNPWQPELSDESVCKRYAKAEEMLKTTSEGDEKLLLDILKNTHQDSLTVYSNIYDLKAQTITTYFKRNFDQPIQIDLKDIFRFGNCMMPMERFLEKSQPWKSCSETAITPATSVFQFSGKLTDEKTGEPLPFANIGIRNENIGTLSDPDGSFQINIPGKFQGDSLTFSYIGYRPLTIPIKASEKELKLNLKPTSKILDEVLVKARKRNKTARLGWMKGNDGVLPFDTLKAGAATAVLLEAPETGSYVQKVMFRLLYNSKDTLQFRLHFYAYDSINDQPGREILQKDIILKDTKKFGWVQVDVSKHEIYLPPKKFFVGFEWINTRKHRQQLYEGLTDYGKWKKTEYEKGNKDIELVKTEWGNFYRHNGNMMNWPGFHELPPWTGLMVDRGKSEKTKAFRTFERKTSFGKWIELSEATLNAVVVLKY